MATTVLVVEDSRVVRAYVCSILRKSRAFGRVIETGDGQEAVDLALSERPDVMLLDLRLPSRDGLQVIGEVMRLRPLPIVVLSGHLDQSTLDLSFDALRAGAVEVIPKPKGLASARMDAFEQQLVRTLNLMAEVKVVRRYRTTVKAHPPLLAPGPVTDPGRVAPKLIAIGASTGGPPVLASVLSAIPAPLPAPLLIAQHIATGFAPGFARWLCRTGHAVRMAEEGHRPQPGEVLVSPADRTLTLRADNVIVFRDLERMIIGPEIDVMFRSVARVYRGSAWGVLLTGMGRDGAHGLKTLRDVGANTIAQDEASSTIYGMPRVAVELGAAQHVLSPARIASMINAAFSHSAPALRPRPTGT